MWLKYVINITDLPIGFKFNYKTEKVVLGGREKILDTMVLVLSDYFDKKSLTPEFSSPGKIKFKFKMKHQDVLVALLKMRKDDIQVSKINSLERIYR
jgi:hypothetical protein